MNTIMHFSFAVRVAAACLAAMSLAAARPALAQSGGQWQLGPNLPFFPAHMHVMPNGHLMMWPGDGGVSGNDPRMLNIATGQITPMTKPGFDVFCSAHNWLPDGRLFVAGGHISNSVGLPESSVFNPANGSWTRQAQMNAGRWYPTSTMLANGDVLVVSGDVDLNQGVNPLPQVWQAATGTWRSLTSAQMSMPLYPYMFLAPNGRVFDAGPSVATRYLDTAGTGAWSFVGNRIFNASRHYGGAVMYEPGKVLVVGGGDPPTNTAEAIDLNTTTPVWRQVGSMATARVQMNSTMLPDGKMLVTGGTKGAGWNNSAQANWALSAEMWDPVNGGFTTMASSLNIPRLYHSIAMLLPDARVFVTGGNGYTQSELYSPPYLFAGRRPSISSAPATVGEGQRFFVGTSNAGSIDAVSWVRLPSVTHTNAMNQGFFRTTAIHRVSGGIEITAPNHTSVPPGHYMLFVLRNGIPSVARIVRLTTAAA